MESLLLSTLFLGTGAGLHCLFMCGPLAAALPVGGLSPGKTLLAKMLHMAGRWLVYLLMGALAGYAGHGISWTGLQLPLLYALLLALVFFAGSWNFDKAKKIREGIRSFGLVLRKQNFHASFFLLGMANGLLPCGMVYAALAQSVLAASAGYGALVMLIFAASSSWWQYMLMLKIRPAPAALSGLRFLSGPRAGLLILSLVMAFRLWSLAKETPQGKTGAAAAISCGPAH